MSILVLGGTGTVGSAVVSELLDRGEAGIRVLTRSADKAADLPQGVEAAVADLTDPTTFDGVFEWTERMFLLNPVSMTELHEGLSALAEARRVGVRKIVYMSVQNPEAGLHIPLVGPDVLTGEACARNWSEALGRELTCGGNDLAATRQLLGQEPRSFDAFTRECAGMWGSN